jgi:hypothetical protein
VNHRERAARAWAFRWAVELQAERAFRLLATELRALGYPAELADECERVAEDEARHVVLCARLANEFGAAEPPALSERDRLAPGSLGREDALAYDLIARCCVAETESTATLVELLPETSSTVREVVHEIATDEVRHSRLGWQFLAWIAPRRDLGFLGPLIPAMLETGGGPLFEIGALDEPDHPELGVFGRPTQLRLFRETLRDVILPGFELDLAGLVPRLVENERFSSGADPGGTLPRSVSWIEENRNEKRVSQRTGNRQAKEASDDPSESFVRAPDGGPGRGS